MKPLLILLLLVFCFCIDLSDASTRERAGERILSFSISNKANEAVVIQCVAEEENFERTLQPGEKIRWRLWTRNGVLNASTMICSVDPGPGILGYFSAFPLNTCGEACKWRVVDGGLVEVKSSGGRWLSFSLDTTKEAAGQLPPSDEAHNTSGEGEDCDDTAGLSPPPPPGPPRKLLPPPQKPNENKTAPAPAEKPPTVNPAFKLAPPPYNPGDHITGPPPTKPPSTNGNPWGKLTPPPNKPGDKPATPPAQPPSTKVNPGGKLTPPPSKPRDKPATPPAKPPSTKVNPGGKLIPPLAMPPLSKVKPNSGGPALAPLPRRPITPPPTKVTHKPSGFENAPSPQKTPIVKTAPSPTKIGVVNGKGEDKPSPSPKKVGTPSPSPSAKTGEIHSKLAPSPSKPKPKNYATSPSPSNGKLKPGSEGKPAAPPPRKNNNCDDDSGGDASESLPASGDGKLAPPPLKPKPLIGIPVFSTPKVNPNTRNDKLAPAPAYIAPHNAVSPASLTPKGQPKTGKDDKLALAPVKQTPSQTNKSPTGSPPKGQLEAGKEVPVAIPPVTQRAQQKKNATSPVASPSKEPSSQVKVTPPPPAKNEDVDIDKPYCEKPTTLVKPKPRGSGGEHV